MNVNRKAYGNRKWAERKQTHGYNLIIFDIKKNNFISILKYF